jgi:hypothetical protein
MSVKHLSCRLSILDQIGFHKNPTKWIFRTRWQVVTPSLLVDEIFSSAHHSMCINSTCRGENSNATVLIISCMSAIG